MFKYSLVIDKGEKQFGLHDIIQSPPKEPNTQTEGCETDFSSSHPGLWVLVLIASVYFPLLKTVRF